MATAEEPVWNLALREIIEGKRYRLVMPDEDGTFPESRKPTHGYIVRWPLNPHFTGESGIASMLNQTEMFRDISIETNQE